MCSPGSATEVSQSRSKPLRLEAVCTTATYSGFRFDAFYCFGKSASSVLQYEPNRVRIVATNLLFEPRLKPGSQVLNFEGCTVTGNAPREV